jgi:predicted transcriptional regulator
MDIKHLLGVKLMEGTGDRMIQAIKMALKYGPMIPVAVEFLKEIEDAVKDREITQAESRKLMKQFWVVVNNYRAAELGLTYSQFVVAQEEKRKVKRKAYRADSVKKDLS